MEMKKHEKNEIIMKHMRKTRKNTCKQNGKYEINNENRKMKMQKKKKIHKNTHEKYFDLPLSVALFFSKNYHCWNCFPFARQHPSSG